MVTNLPQVRGTNKKSPLTHDFGLVVPHLDQSDYLKTCLRSILFQEGESTVHVHVQDGGSTDIAREIIDSLQSEVEDTRFLLTYRREPDRNAADAINKGMAQVNATMVSWLGADDILLPGCFEAIGSARELFPEVRWVTGHPQVLSQRGVMIPVHGPEGPYRYQTGYSREAIRRGLHASLGNHGTIQQEGTFWHSSLWAEVGGLNTELKLAFDFDLWCRLADHTPLIELATPLAAFRKRKGQASENKIDYLAEVKRIRLNRQVPVRGGAKKMKLESLVLLFPSEKGVSWSRVKRPFVVSYDENEVARWGLPHLPSSPYRLRKMLERYLPHYPRLRGALRFTSRLLKR